MKQAAVIAILLALVAGFSLPGAAAPKATGDDQYFPELQNDRDMQVIQSKKNMVSSGISYGAWITPVFMYQENPGSTLMTQMTTFRVWFKTYLWNDSYLYIRGKDTYTAVISKKGSASAKNKNVLDLDLGYITMATPRRNVDFTAGRKYFLLGSGIVMNGRGDGAEFNFYSKYINIKALGSWTGWLVKDDNPYGLSDRDISTGAKRVFAGGKVSTSWYNQTLFFYGLAQFDFGKEYYHKKRLITSVIAGWDPGIRQYNTRTRYQSQYYGMGLEGVIVSGLSYFGEFIIEQGKSYISGYPVRTSINAYAASARLNYYLNVLMKPSLEAQYFFGSGDVNRSDYRSPNGNLWGRDTGFLYFGTFVGGYALKPVLANIHVISASVSFSPFEWVKIYSIKNMNFTAKYYYYLKHHVWSPINNGLDATRPDREIGHEVDVSMRWLIFSDFSFFMNYGVFIPGKAFGFYYDYLYNQMSNSNTSYRHFIMTGFNVSF